MTEKQAEKRGRILDAARKTFARQGFEHTSIRDLAQAAEVADGTVYNYFQDKDAILGALVADLITRLGTAEVQPVGLNDGAHLKERVVARMRGLHDHYEQLAAVLPVVLGSAEWRQTFRTSFVQPVIGALGQEMGLGADDLTPRLLMAAVLGFQVLMLLGDEPSLEAWAHPETLAPLWSRTLAAIHAGSGSLGA